MVTVCPMWATCIYASVCMLPLCNTIQEIFYMCLLRADCLRIAHNYFPAYKSYISRTPLLMYFEYKPHAKRKPTGKHNMALRAHKGKEHLTVKKSCCPSGLRVLAHYARTLRSCVLCGVGVYAKLIVVQLSNLHKTLKSWTTSTYPKNHEERTNGSYFIRSWRSEKKRQ